MDDRERDREPVPPIAAGRRVLGHRMRQAVSQRARMDSVEARMRYSGHYVPDVMEEIRKYLQNE